ncbi:MAG: SpoIIE family protein phosphatase, partial [Clostridia bacterium]|nr:SpoIIE family protein phosphatase [Clostridia bacterium]
RAAGDTGKRDHFPPNGDAITRFECTDGRYYVLICDGMGTGGEASLTSRICSSFLEEILQAGADMTVALTMLNNYMRSRSMECSAGIDLMEIDRYTGEARFVKSGAAPSFVIREGRLFRLCSKTVPIGILRALDAEMIRFTLEKGDIIVMLSDGVTENFEDSAWLCDMLSTRSVTDSSPAEIAQRIVAAARVGVDPARRDDVSAAVMKIA